MALSSKRRPSKFNSFAILFVYAHNPLLLLKLLLLLLLLLFVFCSFQSKVTLDRFITKGP